MTVQLPELTLRNAELGELVELLKAQADVKYDVVVPASRLRYEAGVLAIAGGAARFTDDGVDEVDAMLRPTEVAEEGLGERLGIPRAYLRNLRATGVTVRIGRDDPETGNTYELLLDQNVNGWLQAQPARKFLVRGFRTDDPDELGIARAFLSDRFAPIDNLDVLTAALAGVRAAGAEIEVVSANLSERNMRVSVIAPAVTALAPVLLGNYRSPYSSGGDEGQGTVRDAGGKELPVVFAGFEIRNGETGGSAFSIVPRVVVRICGNGMTKTIDAMRQVHLGGRLEEGEIAWSADTQRKAVELVTAKTRDAVARFLSPEYVAGLVADIEHRSATPIEDAAGTIERVAKVHAFSEGEQASILDCFIRSGDLTAGGVMQAVTATAQRIDNPDRAAEMEDVALEVLATASR